MTTSWIGHFQRDVHPLRDALRFGNERGLTSTASPLPGMQRLGAVGVKNGEFEIAPKSAETRSRTHAH